MTKRKVKRNHSKRPKINSYGFKVYKNFKLYIAESTPDKPEPRKELIEMIRDEFWNTDKSVIAMRKHIKQMSFTYTKTQHYIGLWDYEKQKISIKDNGIDSINNYKSLFVHEIIGHTFYDFSRKWRRVELIAFNKRANELPPVNSYIKKHELEWKNSKTSIKEWMNDENDDFEQFKKSVEHIPEWDANEELQKEYQEKQDAFNENRKTNGHDTITRYANEQHSAITEYVYGNMYHKTLLNQKDVDRLKKLWEALHY